MSNKTRYSNEYLNARAGAECVIIATPVEELRHARAALIQVANGRITNTNCGICRNARVLMPEGCTLNIAYHCVDYFSHGWPHHSGDLNYPVPKPADPFCGHWQNEQLILRQHLLAYLVEQMTVYIEESRDAN